MPVAPPIPPVHREIPQKLTDPAIILFCLTCERPVIGLDNLGFAGFETLDRRGYLMMSKNASMPSVTVVTIGAEVAFNLYSKVGDPKFWQDDECAYEQLLCDCGCVIGLRVSAAGKGSVLRSGTITLLVRCLGLRIGEQMISLDRLSKLVG
jgi:hypothetical protein